MLLYALCLFALAALFGMYMLMQVLGGRLPPWFAAILHGVFAATGLVLLLYAAFLSGGPAPALVLVAAVLLVVAALGGFVMVASHLQKKVPPKPLALIHAGAAVLGVVSLAAVVFGFA